MYSLRSVLECGCYVEENSVRGSFGSGPISGQIFLDICQSFPIQYAPRTSCEEKFLWKQGKEEEYKCSVGKNKIYFLHEVFFLGKIKFLKMDNFF